MIRIREVRVIDEDGQQLGVMPTIRAQQLAREKGLDLVEVAPTAVPPVCRILDYGQYKYELQKRDRDAKKKQKGQSFKEVRLAVKIDTNDLRTKVRRAGEFLDDGHRVKVTVRFRGREISHANLGRDLLMKAADMISEHGVIERQPLLEGRSMYIVMAPHEKRAEKKSETGEENGTTASVEPGATGDTIGDAVAARPPERSEQPEPAAEPAAATEEPAPTPQASSQG
jgi:translation initiation factor IF-3